MHTKAKISHNGLQLSQILFDKRGNTKLGLGINQIFKCKQDSSSSLAGEKLSLYEASEINSPAYFKKMSTNENDKNELKAQDIFDIGYILLVAATGGLDLFSQETLDLKMNEK